MNPTEHDKRCVGSQSKHAWVAPAASTRISTFRLGRFPDMCPGNWASALRVTAM